MVLRGKIEEEGKIKVIEFEKEKEDKESQKFALKWCLSDLSHKTHLYHLLVT